MGACAWAPHLVRCVRACAVSAACPVCFAARPGRAPAVFGVSTARPRSCSCLFSATISVSCRLLVFARAPRPLLSLQLPAQLSLPPTWRPLPAPATSHPWPPRALFSSGPTAFPHGSTAPSVLPTSDLPLSSAPGIPLPTSPPVPAPPGLPLPPIAPPAPAPPGLPLPPVAPPADRGPRQHRPSSPRPLQPAGAGRTAG